MTFYSVIICGFSLILHSPNAFQYKRLTSKPLQGYTSCHLKVYKYKEDIEYTRQVPRFYCTEIDSSTKVCQRLTNEKKVMTIERGNDVLIEWDNEAIDAVWEGIFDVLIGDIDNDKIDELIIAELQGISMGFGGEYWTLYILDNFGNGDVLPPTQLKVNVYGHNGTFIKRGKEGKCEILSAEWKELNHPKRGWGMYLVGKWLRYNNGQLKLIADRPIIIRRFLFSFEKERGTTLKITPLPLKWFQNKKIEFVDQKFINQYSEKD